MKVKSIASVTLACALALGTVPVSGYAADSATLGQEASPTPSTSAEPAGSAASSAAQPASDETASAKDGSAVGGSESEKSTARTDVAAPAASAEGENPSAATSAKEAAPASASEQTGSDKSASENVKSAQEAAGDNKYQGKVSFIGQWTNESASLVNTEKTFASASDKLGEPATNPGTLRSLAKIFLGWSDKPLNDKRELAEGARLFTASDTVGSAFPDGIPQDAKMYGVYYSVNDADSPFNPSGGFTGGLQYLGLVPGLLPGGLINNNSVEINKETSAENTLPDTTLSSTNESTEEVEVNGKKQAVKTNTVIDTYKKKDDANTINETVFTSEFKMNDTVAMLVYRNKVGSNAFRPILSYDYNQRYAENGEFNTKDGFDAGYTYVDLNVDLDPQLTVPETLYLEYKGYSWRPLYVLGADKKQLEVVNPSNEAGLGNTKASFGSLVSNTDPRVTFGVKTEGNHKLTVRMVLREGEAEKISEGAIKPAAGKTVAEEILSNMTLRALSTADLKTIMPDKSQAELNKRVLRVDDAVAYELASSQGQKTLQVTGSVNGHVFASAGSLNAFGFSIPLAANRAIDRVLANMVKVGYVLPKFKVTYEFASATPGKDLPEAVVSQVPANNADVENGFEPTFARTFDDVLVKGGIWTFKQWTVDANGTRTPIDATAKLAVDREDLKLVGEWEFVETKVPDDAPKIEVPEGKLPEQPAPSTPEAPVEPKLPETPAPSEDKVVVPPATQADVPARVSAAVSAKLPVTGDAFVIAAVVAGVALASSGALAFVLRKRRAEK